MGCREAAAKRENDKTRQRADGETSLTCRKTTLTTANITPRIRAGDKGDGYRDEDFEGPNGAKS